MKGKGKISIVCMMFLINILLIAPLVESQQPVNITESTLSDGAKSLNGSFQVIGSSGEVKDNFVANISREDAYNRVLKNVLNGNTSGKWIYASPSLVAAGTAIATWYGDIVMPNSEGWLFFIDDMPMQSWAHPCRFVHVDGAGATTIVDAYGPPMGLETWAKIAGNVQLPQPVKPSILPIQGPKIQLPPCTNLENCYAVLISGGADKYNNWPRYYSDIQFMYHVLNVDYGYLKNNIYVLMSDGTDPAADMCITPDDPSTPQDEGVYSNSNPDLDGDGNNEVRDSATRAHISTVFNDLQARMGPNGHLFIFTTDHGGPENTPQVGTNVILNLWGDQIKDDQFNAELAKIPTTDPIDIVMEQCFSGGFVDDVIPTVPLPTGQERVIATAANAYEYSWGDFFSKLWISAVAGYELGGSPVDADTNNDGVVTMQEAFNYANANDNSGEHPQYKDTPSDVGSTHSLSSCYATNPFVPGWSSLGGYVTSSSSIVVDNAGKTEAWVKGGDNALWVNIDGTWRCKGGVLTSDPFAVKDYNGKIHVLVRGNDYAVWDYIYNPVTSNGHWRGLGGYVTSRPVGAMEPTYHNFLRVAARGGDNALWQCDLNINTETTNWYTNGGILTSGPYVIFDPDSRQHTFIRGADNSLWDCEGLLGSDTMYHWTWGVLGGSLSSGPTACIEPTYTDYVAVFVKGVDNALWMCDVDSATQPETGTWYRLGGIIASDPLAVEDTSANKIHVFARGLDSALWENIFSTSPWDPNGYNWQGIGGSMLTYTPGAAVGCKTQAFVIGTDHALWRNTHATFSAVSSGGDSSQKQEEPNQMNYPAGDPNSGGGKSLM
jgi:hypothetical protein